MGELEHISQYRIDRLAADLVSDAEAVPIHAHMESCVDCAARYEEARVERGAFLAVNPPEARAKQLLETESPSLMPKWLVPTVSAVAAVTAVVIVFPLLDDRPDIITKGGPILTFSVKEPGAAKVREGISGETFPPKTALQLHFKPAGFSNIAVYGMDAKGEITHISSLFSERPTDLSSSLLVDEEGGDERIVVVFSKSPVPAETVKDAAASAFEESARQVSAVEAITLSGQRDAHVRSILVRKSQGVSAPGPE